MAAMQKECLRPLTVAEQRELRAIAKASSERIDRVKRATALLAVAGGETFAAASRAAGYRSIGAVTYLVRRFNRAGLDALGIAAGLRRDGTGPDRGDRPAATGSESRWHRHVVALDPGADGASGGAPARGRDDDPTGAARRGQFVPADADVVPDRDGPAEAQGGRGAGGGSADGRKKGAIDLAYRLAEAAGTPLWCKEGAGPSRATPHGGAGGAPVGERARLPHEYVRGG